jgi:hypothetical protein
LIQGLEETLPEITNSALQALALLDPDVGLSKLAVQSAAHLRLDSHDPSTYIGEHLTGADSSYVPDAFAFNVVASGSPAQKHARIVVAVSALFEGSVFVDYAAEYANPLFTAAAVAGMRSDYGQRLAGLGLEEETGEERK